MRPETIWRNSVTLMSLLTDKYIPKLVKEVKNTDTFVNYRGKVDEGEWIDMDEIKEIDGLSGYFVSPRGYVISCKRSKPIILRPYIDDHGYYIYGFFTNDKKIVFKKLHRLLAEAFIPNPNHLPFVLHYDDDRDNNRLSNLRWGTPKENSQDMKRNEHDLHRPVYCLELNTFYRSTEDAAKAIGVSRTSITAICKGRAPSIHGIHFCYSEDKKKYDEDPSLWPIGKNGAILGKNIVTGEERIFKNRNEAAKVLSLSLSEMSAVINGKRRTTHGWTLNHYIPIHREE